MDFQWEVEEMKFVQELSDRQRRELKDALENWDDTKEVRRARAIWMSHRGWTVPHIADALDVCRRTVREWIDKYDDAGLEGIKTKPRSGRPPEADQQYVERLEEVAQGCPREFGYPFSTWTREYLAMHMEKETGTSISARHIGRLLKRLGFVYKRARYDLSHKRDPEEYEDKKKELGGLKKRAISVEPEFDLLFLDEAEVHLNPPLTRVWARRGKPARVPSAGVDEKVVILAGWNFATDAFYWMLAENKNSDVFIEFLKQLIEERRAARKAKLVMDNAPYHRSKRTVGFLERHSGQLEPFWLPSYSPELNLIERVWHYLKEKVVNNYFFGSLDRLMEAVRRACRELNSTHEAILDIDFKTAEYLCPAA